MVRASDLVGNGTPPVQSGIATSLLYRLSIGPAKFNASAHSATRGAMQRHYYHSAPETAGCRPIRVARGRRLFECCAVTLAGFALAGGGTSFSLANGLGTGRSDLFQAGAFVRHNVGPAYISAALAYGWQDITTDRNVTIAGLDRLHAEFNANAFSGRVEGGYRFVTPWTGGIGITPYAAGQFTTFDLPAYAESAISGANTFALAYGSKSVMDPRSEIGVRTDKSFAERRPHPAWPRRLGARF